MPIATKFSNVIVSTGDQIRLRTPGGGGYGDPLEREPGRVLRDVIDGYVSAAAAERDYGVVVVQLVGAWQIDAEATARLRQALAGQTRRAG